jgi:hypothetical protein
LWVCGFAGAIPQREERERDTTERIEKDTARRDTTEKRENT